MIVIMVVFWAALITAVVLAIRYLADSGSHRNQPSSGPALVEDVLAERFARGEIDEDEFRRRITLLREHR
jgi:putative membrane protein